MEVIYFRQEAKADAQVLMWLDGLSATVQDKCLACVGLLREKGNELRRPTADKVFLKIRELRPTWQGVHYRILYAFAGKDKAILLHGCIKVAKIKQRDIAIALRKLGAYKADPELHSYIEE